MLFNSYDVVQKNELTHFNESKQMYDFIEKNVNIRLSKVDIGMNLIIVDNDFLILGSSFNEDFNVQAISIIEIVVKDKKCIGELSKALQRTIKNFVILKFIYEDKQFISFALKRLNMNNTNDIVIDTLITTEELEISDLVYNEYIDYKKILNKSN